MREGERYLLSGARLSHTQNGQVYGNLSLIDVAGKTEMLNVWGMSSIPKVPSMVVISTLKESRGSYSCSLSQLRIEDVVDDEFRKYVVSVVSLGQWNVMRDSIGEMIEDDVLRGVWCEACDKLYGPYSTHIGGRILHHAYKGGLLNHTYDILNMFVGLSGFLAFKVNPFIFAMGALFHDYYKMSEYDEENSVTAQISLIGHPAGGYEAVGAFLRKKAIDPQLVMFVQHCVLSHHGRLEYGSPVVPCNQEAMLLSKLDEISASGEAMSRTKSGQKSKDIVVYHYED